MQNRVRMSEISAITLFNEDEVQKDSEEVDCLNQIKDWIKCDSNLMYFEEFLDDRFLLHFIRGRKMDTKRAFLTLQNYFYMRKMKYRELFIGLVPSKLRFQDDCIRICRNLGPNGERIGVNRVCWWGEEDAGIPADDFIRKALIVLEDVWNFEEAEKNGIIAILDASGFGFTHFKTIGTPHQIQKIIGTGWNSFPLRYRQVHFVNCPFYFSMVLTIAKQILPTKLGKRLHSHGYKMESLHKHLSPNILPDFLGGNLTDDEAFDTKACDRINKKEDYYQRLANKL